MVIGEHMKRIMQNKAAIAIFVLPALILFITIVIVPIFMSLYYSLNDWDGTGGMVYVGFKNYASLFSSAPFLKSMLNSIRFAFASVFIQLPISMLLALVLAYRVKGERFFITVYFIPVILASVVIGQLWMRIYNQDYGVLNLFLKALNPRANPPAWLGDMKTALVAVIAPVLWQYVGYHMLLFYSGIKSISPDIFEAAKIDGASFRRTSLSITLPMLRPVIMVSVTFAVVGSMKVYDLVKVLTNGGPAGSSDVITTLLVRTMIYPGNNYGYGSSMAVVLIIECFAFYMLIGRLFREKEDAPAKTIRKSAA